MKEILPRTPIRPLSFDENTRRKLWKEALLAVEKYTKGVDGLPIMPKANPGDVRTLLEAFSFEKSSEPLEILNLAIKIFSNYSTHTAHPGYFGLFDPAPSTMGILAELLVATFNPQLAVWTQSPAGVEIEQFLVQKFGEKFGFKPDSIDGTFTAGGAEANHTAVLTAITEKFPDFGEEGLLALKGQPVLYVSAEAHHSVLKAARLCGLGNRSVRFIKTDAKLKMDSEILAGQIAKDKADGMIPFLIVATAGTTNAGIMDPIESLVEIARRENIWLHVDAAWGGAIALVPELQFLLKGIEQADSITFDPHKWLSVPRGAGLYLTRKRNILNQTFQVTASYMPLLKENETVVDSFNHSIQWSRRCTGLKLFMTLAVEGWGGYAATIRQNLALAEYMRKELERAGWAVINDSALAVLCFVDGTRSDGQSREFLDQVRKLVVEGGQAWISTTCLAGRTPALRACIVNFRSTEKDVDILIENLDQARKSIGRLNL
jgi:glutamate/tyrosine decarboxylase-like PLP-dependent enzyme